MFVRMNFLIKSLMLGLFFIIFSPFVLATTMSNTPNIEKTQSVVGYWQTIDGKTKKPSSIIAIVSNGQFYDGQVAKTFPLPDEQKTSLCVACKGNQKNKPILGLTIIKNMICRSGVCSKGTILDPRDGKIYHATMRLVNNGEQLKVRGYVGMPMFGKTVVWNRVSKSAVQ